MAADITSKDTRAAKRLLRPQRDSLIRVSAACANPDVLPGKFGAYACYFSELPPVPEIDYIKCGELSLLYVGIGEGQTVCDRWRLNHIGGKARNSTLRFSLGILLERSLRLRLVKKPTTKDQIWFGEKGENRLTDWMKSNIWIAAEGCQDPDAVERWILAREGWRLPLNYQHNSENLFRAELSRRRTAARRRALGTNKA